MTTVTFEQQLKKVIHENDLEGFKKLMDGISELPINVELDLVNSKKIEFLKYLVQSKKLSNKIKLVIGGLTDSHVRKILKIESLI